MGRSCIFGHIEKNRSIVNRRLGDEEHQKVTSFCYEDWGGTIHNCLGSFKFAVTTEPGDSLGDSSSAIALMAPTLTPFLVSQYPRNLGSSWCASCASLDGVFGIQLCIDEVQRHRPVLGMMLHYQNSREVLGQWRFDRIISDIVKNPSRINFRLCPRTKTLFEAPGEFYSHVEAVNFNGTEDGDWSYEMRGWLTWWFSQPETVFITHHDEPV